MNQSLEWRLARTFVRCYSLVLLINLMQAIFGPILGLWIASYDYSGVRWDIRAVAISASVAWLAAIVILWRYSDKIANKLAGTQDSAIEGEQLDFPFDVGVSLAGLIFFVEGLKGVAADAVVWYLSKSDMFPFTRPEGVVNVRHLAAYSAEAILGLVLFVGAKSLVTGIMKLRGMPPSTDEEDAV